MSKGERPPHELSKETRERVSPDAAALRRERKKDANIQFLFALYRGKWERSGGHTDPATFKDVSPGVLKWAQGADREMKNRLAEPGDMTGIRGTALELFLGVEIEEQKWFGGEVVRVAAVDDFANGLDLALEWERDEELGVIPRLAVDFTTSEARAVLMKKMKKLSSGTAVNFFRSKVEPFEGRVSDLPMVILGLNTDVLSDVATRLMSGGRISPEHPLRHVLLQQVMIQVDLQIRALAAELVAAAIDQPSDNPTSSNAVQAYADGIRTDPHFTKDMPRTVEILRSIPTEDMQFFLKSKQNAARLRTLLAVHRRLFAQVKAIGQPHSVAKKMAAKLKLTKRLKNEDA